VKHTLTLLLAVFASACGAGVPDIYEQCDLLGDLAPAEASAGAEVQFTGGPQSDVYDTSVSVDGASAEVVAIDRIDCDACDSCREDFECLACGTCVDCVEACAPCVETLTFRIPADAPAGPTSIAMLNRYGGTPALPFTVIGAEDSADTGIADTGATDTSVDTGSTSDTSAPHTGDTAPTDTGDTGAQHTGDTGTRDTSPADTGVSDTSSPRDTAPVHTGDTGPLHTGDTASTTSP
jgi:hypothetical protein